MTPQQEQAEAFGSLRIDAARNRERILAAAREVFADGGIAAPLEQVAQRAGVGIATLYRRFPTRGDLVSAAFQDKLQALVDAAELALANGDPWEGFSTYLLTVCEMQATDRGFAALFSAEALDDPRIHDYCTRALVAFERLVDAAKTSGALRADFATNDLLLLLNANAGVGAATRDVDPEAWRRMVGYMLDGFRVAHAS
jgi:AcrR family transcriptional regulator